MARLPRFVLPGQPQHVIQRGNNRSPIFFTDWDYRFYLQCLEEGCAEYRCDVHAYVLMTNHVHLVASPQSEDGLSRLMQSVGRRFVQHINRRYQRTGTLWDGRFRATAIDSERYLLTCYRYVELNPVRAGMVEDPIQYRWSSHAHHAVGRRDSVVRDHPIYLSLGGSDQERLSVYRSLFDDQIGEHDLAEIRDATNKGWVLGNDRFRGQIEERTNRRARPMPRGGKRAGAGRRADDEESTT